MSKKVTITIPHDTAYQLYILLINSNKTKNEEFDNHMNIIIKKLKFKL